jgi:uncharacterized membrane protein (DUF373 family)
MTIKEELRETGEQFRLLSLYQRFEHIVVILLTALIAVIVVAALWTLTLKILFGLVLAGGLDPSDYSAFQAVFGMILAVVIALEFKKSILVLAERRDTVIQIRSVVMIALLAICRKVIILDLTETDALHILALAAAILALGIIYWLFDRRAFGQTRKSPDDRAVLSSADEDRQFLKRIAAGAWQHNMTGGIVELEVSERNSDELAAECGEIADGKDHIDVAVLAKYEIVDPSDRLVLVVDYGS